MENAIIQILDRLVGPLLPIAILVVMLTYATKLSLRFLNWKRLCRWSGIMSLFWSQLLCVMARIDVLARNAIRVQPLWLGYVLTGFVVQALANSLYDTILKHLDRAYVEPRLKSDD